jgi:hypothetical protein
LIVIVGPVIPETRGPATIATPFFLHRYVTEPGKLICTLNDAAPGGLYGVGGEIDTTAGDGQHSSAMHVATPVGVPPALWQFDGVPIRHANPGKQHASGHGDGTQLVACPWNTPPWPKQLGPCTTVHVAPTQHAPGCGHGFGTHDTPAPEKVRFASVHTKPISTTHAPDGAQHAPGTHSVGEHAVLARNDEVHPAGVVTVHAPPAVQHAPTATGHISLGPQVGESGSASPVH